MTFLHFVSNLAQWKKSDVFQIQSKLGFAEDIFNIHFKSEDKRKNVFIDFWSRLPSKLVNIDITSEVKDRAVLLFKKYRKLHF